MFDNFFDNAPSDGIFQIFATSQGALHLKNALKNYPEDRCKRIRVTGVAPAAYISEKKCHSVRNYEAKWHRDLIPQLEWFSRYKNRHTIEVVPSHPSAPFHDHSFSSPTFESYIFKEIQKYFHLMDYK
jgi:hypothetical protein